MSRQFGRTAVHMSVRRTARRRVRGFVHVFRHVRGRARRGHVTDRGDVIPVEAVADPEDQRGTEKTDATCRREFGKEMARQDGPPLLQRVAIAWVTVFLLSTVGAGRWAGSPLPDQSVRLVVMMSTPGIRAIASRADAIALSERPRSERSARY